MAVTAQTPIELVQGVYGTLQDRVATGRRRLGRPLTLAEKILVNHLAIPRARTSSAGTAYADFRPDRVAMQDATAQMALLQFMTAGLDEVAAPTTVHCDHLIQAKEGAGIDLTIALDDERRGLRLPPHRVGRVRHRLLEAGLGDHPSGRARELRVPRRDDDRHRQPHAERRRPRHGRDRRRRRRRRRRDDRLPVQRALAEADRRAAHRLALRMVVAEGRDPQGRARSSPSRAAPGAIVEYFGPGADSISATGKGTICNMGAEIGATTSLFPYDANMAMYLKATGREAIADAAERGGRATCARTRRSRPTRAASSTASSRSTCRRSSR